MKEEKLHKIREAIKKYAKAKAERVYLSEFKKSLRAIKMKEAEKQGVKSAAAQERDANAHREYQELLKGLKEATEVEENLRWNLVILQQDLEQKKAETYQHTAEMKMQGGVDI